jgi:RimJ/RimL family protein N-acetyltransferase
MIFERTTDYALIKQIITTPAIFTHASDDFSPAAEQWEPVQSDQIWYVLVKDGAELLGLFMLVPENAICWKVHTCLLPNAWGRKAKQAAKEGIEWVWKNMPSLRLITDVPEYNRQASIFARWAGMTEFGVNPKSYMKHGKLQDVTMLGISKPEAN